MPLDPAKIKSRREALGLSQAQAASRASMPQPHWARIEAGVRANPALDTAERVAKALRVPLAGIVVIAKAKRANRTNGERRSGIW